MSHGPAFLVVKRWEFTDRRRAELAACELVPGGHGELSPGGFWCMAVHASCGRAKDTNWGRSPKGVRKDHTESRGLHPCKSQTWVQQLLLRGMLQKHGFCH